VKQRGARSEAPLPRLRRRTTPDSDGRKVSSIKELVGADQRDRRPSRHCRPDRPVSQAMCHVHPESRRDAQAKQPPRQYRHSNAAPRRIEHHHRTRIDQPVHGQRDETSSSVTLTVLPDESARMLVRYDRSDERDAEHSQCG
jgi:hypothetical protein